MKDCNKYKMQWITIEQFRINKKVLDGSIFYKIFGNFVLVRQVKPDKRVSKILKIIDDLTRSKLFIQV